MTCDEIYNGVFTDTQGKFGEENKEYDLASLDSKIAEEIGYYLTNREDYIDELITFMYEARNTNDYSLMKEDLRKLMQFDDEYIFLSTNDNSFLIQSECNEIERWYKKQGVEGKNEFDNVLGEYIKAVKDIELQNNNEKDNRRQK